MTPPSILDPLLLARVGDLELVARTIVDGLRSGPHRSPFHGYSAEFSQYRHYRPGDDLKYVDWKLAARTDRIYTKQFRETTDLAAAFVIDCSGSMGFSGEGPTAGLSKLRYASMAAAALAYVIADQGDAVGLLAFQGITQTYVPARTGQHHLRGVLARLSQLQAAEMGLPHMAVRRAADLVKRRGLLLVFSDFYDQEQATLSEIRRAVRTGHDVAVFQVVTRSEIEFPYRTDTQFQDLESGQRVVTHAGDIRMKYKDALTEFLERWRTHARAEGVDYTLLVTDTPLDDALRDFLMRRSQRRAG
jgi:uncharacterized protein (DUF58 family)